MILTLRFLRAGEDLISAAALSPLPFTLALAVAGSRCFVVRLRRAIWQFYV